VEETSSEVSWIERNSFLLRRLHSLTGLVPIGLYMVIHISANATVFFGAGVFQEMVVNRIHDLGPLLPFVEWTFIFIPLLFHAIFGFYIIAEGLPNTGGYPYVSNIRYTLQRATGIIAFAAIFFHVAQMHHMFEPLKAIGFAQFNPDYAASSAATAIQSSVIVIILYVIGVLACVYHLANGIWTSGITWGLWTSPDGQRRAGAICFVFGAALSVAGLVAIGSMATLNIEKAQQEEQRILDGGPAHADGETAASH
jgi:succinate dehydrogenase / fumarate reductase cytochrome b subunit